MRTTPASITVDIACTATAMRSVRQAAAAGALVLALAGCATGAGASGISAPLDDFALRQTPLHFGLHVTPDPDSNPIDPPERFTGYHVGLDVEVGAAELDKDVAVHAICAGPVVYSGFAGGYGGLVVQACTVGKQAVTVIYGHLALDNLPGHGAALKSGDRIAVLAPARSYGSDGNRKHLHLGIHSGSTIDMRGYVQTAEETRQFIDPMTVLPHAGLVTLMQPPIQPYWRSSGSASSAR